MSTHSILWRRLDKPGHESALLSLAQSRQRLVGTSIFAHDREPCRLDYVVVCDSAWKTISGKVSGWIGNKAVEIELSVDSTQRWMLNGTDSPMVRGCIDLDLNFSPSTNLLPVRRLNLAIGQEATVKVAWLRFPGFTLEPLEQLYRRLDAGTYRYESAGGRFVADLTVNGVGFVTHYSNFWQADADR